MILTPFVPSVLPVSTPARRAIGNGHREPLATKKTTPSQHPWVRCRCPGSVLLESPGTPGGKNPGEVGQKGQVSGEKKRRRQKGSRGVETGTRQNVARTAGGPLEESQEGKEQENGV